MKFWKISGEGISFVTVHETEKNAYANAFKNIGVDCNVEERYLTVSVRFPHSDKSYTYFTDKKYKIGDYLVVEAFEKVYGVDTMTLKIVQVVGCCSRTREELERALPFNRYKRIYGEVKPA